MPMDGKRRVFWLPLSDRPFHFEIDQAFEFHAVFHGELAHEIVHESVDQRLMAWPSVSPRCCM